MAISFRAHPPTRRGSVLWYPGRYLVVQSLVAGFGRLLVSACLPSGALVSKRHTCVNFVVSSNTGGAWDNAKKYILAGGWSRPRQRFRDEQGSILKRYWLVCFCEFDFATGGGSGSDLDGWDPTRAHKKCQSLLGSVVRFITQRTATHLCTDPVDLRKCQEQFLVSRKNHFVSQRKTLVSQKNHFGFCILKKRALQKNRIP